MITGTGKRCVEAGGPDLEPVTSLSELFTDPAWDEYVLHHPDPHHEQLCGWAVARRMVGWRPIRVLTTVDGQLVAGAQLLEKSIARGIKIGYLNRGPLWTPGAPLAPLLAELRQLARRRRWLYLALSLPYLAFDAIPLLEKTGFMRRPEELPPDVWTRSTTSIDLTEDQDVIFSRFRATLRNRIRLGEKAGVGFAEGGRADLGIFWTLMCALCERRNSHPNVPGLPFLEALWDQLAPLGAIRLVLGTCQGETISAMIVMTLGAVARDWRVGVSDSHRRIEPSKVFYWDTIKWVKRQGYQVFDFCGIDYRDASELVAGRPASAPFKCGVTEFKCGFGGRIQLLPGEFCFFPNPVIRRLFRWGGNYLLRNRFVTGLAAHLDRRSTAKVPRA